MLLFVLRVVEVLAVTILLLLMGIITWDLTQDEREARALARRQERREARRLARSAESVERAKARLRHMKEEAARVSSGFFDETSNEPPFVVGFSPEGDLLAKEWFIPSPAAQADFKEMDRRAGDAILENTKEL